MTTTNENAKVTSITAAPLTQAEAETLAAEMDCGGTYYEMGAARLNLLGLTLAEVCRLAWPHLSVEEANQQAREIADSYRKQRHVAQQA